MNEQSRSIPEAPPEVGRFDADSAERSWTLPALSYRDPDIQRHEQDAIFARTRQYLLHDFYFRGCEPGPAESEFVRWVREVLSAEDIGICEHVQRGLRSLAYTQGKLLVDRAASDRSEHHAHIFQRHVHAALTGG